MSMTYNKRSEENDRRFVVTEHSTLLKWLIENVEGNSRSRLKAILQGRGVRVDGKCVTQFDYPLEPGMQLEVSKSKRNEVFKSRYFRGGRAFVAEFESIARRLLCQDTSTVSCSCSS